MLYRLLKVLLITAAIVFVPYWVGVGVVYCLPEMLFGPDAETILIYSYGLLFFWVVYIAVMSFVILWGIFGYIKDGE